MMTDVPEKRKPTSHGAENAETVPEVLTSREVYQGKIIKLRVDEIALSGGRTTTREVVQHPGAVVIVPLDRDGEVVLVRQYRHAIGRYLLDDEDDDGVVIPMTVTFTDPLNIASEDQERMKRAYRLCSGGGRLLP